MYLCNSICITRNKLQNINGDTGMQFEILGGIVLREVLIEEWVLLPGAGGIEIDGVEVTIEARFCTAVTDDEIVVDTVD